VIAWGELTLAALFAVAVIDLSLFGWSLRAVGLGRRFDGPAPHQASVSPSTVR